MHNKRRRLVAGCPACIRQTSHQVDFFEIEKETGIEEADFLDGLEAEHHAGACNPIDDAGRRIGRKSRPVSIEKP